MALKHTKPSAQLLETYFFVVQFVAEHGYQPSQREIADALGIKQASVRDRITGLAHHGLVQFEHGQRDVARALKLKGVKFTPSFDRSMIQVGKWMESML